MNMTKLGSDRTAYKEWKNSMMNAVDQVFSNM